MKKIARIDLKANKSIMWKHAAYICPCTVVVDESEIATFLNTMTSIYKIPRKYITFVNEADKEKQKEQYDSISVEKTEKLTDVLVEEVSEEEILNKVMSDENILDQIKAEMDKHEINEKKEKKKKRKRGK